MRRSRQLIDDTHVCRTNVFVITLKFVLCVCVYVFFIFYYFYFDDSLHVYSWLCVLDQKFTIRGGRSLVSFRVVYERVVSCVSVYVCMYVSVVANGRVCMRAMSNLTMCTALSYNSHCTCACSQVHVQNCPFLRS